MHLNTECMKFLEKDLEQIIYEADTDSLNEKGLFVTGKCYRQLRIGGYGVADLVYVDRPAYCKSAKRHMNGKITIIELKKDKVSVSSFFQALNYVKGIQRYLEKRRPINDHLFHFEICLIGKEVDKNSSLVYLPDIFGKELLEFDETQTIVTLYEYDYTFNGINFNSLNGYILKHEGI